MRWSTELALMAAVPLTAILTVWSSWRLSPHGFLISNIALFTVCRQCAGRRYKPHHLRAFCKRQNAFHPEAGQSWPITPLSNCIMLKKRWNQCSWHKMLGRLWMTRKISSPGLNILDPRKILITDFSVENHSCPRACVCLYDDDQWILVDIIIIILLMIQADIIIINIMIRILANIMDQLGDLGRHAADIMAGIGLQLMFLFYLFCLFSVCMYLLLRWSAIDWIFESDLLLKKFN